MLLNEEAIKNAAKKSFDQFMGAITKDHKIGPAGLYESGFVEGYSKATLDIRAAKEKAAMDNIREKFPKDCADHFKPDPKDGLCRVTDCIMNTLPEMSSLISTQGCECYMAAEVLELIDPAKVQEYQKRRAEQEEFVREAEAAAAKPKILDQHGN